MEGSTIFFIIVFIIVIIVILVGIRKKRYRNEDWANYQKALKSGDKTAALNAGRRYYQGVRGGRLTIYDEQAITNDIAAMDAVRVGQKPTNQHSVADELAKLKAMLDNGDITQDEYQKLKNGIIAKFD